MRIRPHWRKMTWAVLIFNIIMLIWLVFGVAAASHPSNCGTLSTQTCQAATDVGAGIGAFVVIVLWALGDVILGVLWLVTRGSGRDCPVCGVKVKRGITECGSCGYDFKSALGGIRVDEGTQS